MLSSQLIKENPKLYIFLPIYYTLWADSVLTTTEIQEMNSLIDKQRWLTEDEKKWLHSQIDPSKPPRPKDLKSWKSSIKKLNLDGIQNLFEIGKALAQHHAGGSTITFENNLETDFQETELALGLLSKEAGFSFKRGHQTVTTEYHKESNFDIGKMTALLNGNQAALIQNVKKVISDPAFAFREYESLLDQREQVLKWCQELSKQGYGSWAFPEYAGGKDDMEGYFTITLNPQAD